MTRVTALMLLTFAAACSSSSEDASTSTGEITAGDAGTEAAAPNACVPCGERFAAGLKKYEAARRSCYCTEDVCRDACGSSICPLETKPTNAACNDCVASHTKCVLSIQSACESDGECKKYVLCKVDTPCDATK